jgi:hypothetical protein
MTDNTSHEIAKRYLRAASNVGIEIEFLDIVNELLASDERIPVERALADAAWDLKLFVL